jgi:transcriptional regulator with XRE-family HTH domain
MASPRAAAQHIQRRLYGLPLVEVVHRITYRLDISQAELARTLGLSPPMLCQLTSGQRVRIGDPTALARLVVLDRESVDIAYRDRASEPCPHAPPRPPYPRTVDALQHHPRGR